MWTSLKRIQTCALFAIVAYVQANAHGEAGTLKLGDIVQDVMAAGQDESKRILSSVRSTVQDLESKVDQKAESLEAAVKKETALLREEAARESQKIMAAYEEKAVSLQQKTAEQMLAIKQQAAEQVLALVSRAEEEALKAKQQARDQMLKQKLTSVAKLEQDTSWKAELKHGFVRSLAAIKAIIVEGESPSEVSDFEKRFDNQTVWFDKTLASTQNRYDQTFYQLSQKKTALSNIVAAQEQAEQELKERIATLGQPLPDYRRLRVLLLYEINCVMNKKSGDGVAAIAATTLTKSEIDTAVERVLQQAAKPVVPAPVQVAVAAPAPVVASAVVPVSSDIMLKLDKLQTQVDQGLELSRQLQTALQQGNAGAAARLQQAVADAEKRTVQQCKQYFVPRLETASKDIYDLQSIVMDKSERLARSHDELKRWQAVANDQKKELSQAQKEVTLVDELADRRLAEQASFYDVKKTYLTERSQAQAARERNVRERERWLDQLSTEIMHEEQKAGIGAQVEAQNREQLEQELNQKIELERSLKK